MMCYQYFFYLIPCHLFLYQHETYSILFIIHFTNNLSNFQVKKIYQDTGALFMVYAPTSVHVGIINTPAKQYKTPYGSLCQQGASLCYMLTTAPINTDKIIKIL